MSADITADEVRVGDTITDKGHALPFKVTAREDQRGWVWLRSDIGGRQQWSRMAPEHPVHRVGGARVSLVKANGYVCKRCNTPSPVGVGFAAVNVTPDPARTSCACGYSVKAQ